MSRSVRIEYNGAVYHVMSRGDHGEVVFNGDDDRRMLRAGFRRYHRSAYCFKKLAIAVRLPATSSSAMIFPAGSKMHA